MRPNARSNCLCDSWSQPKHLTRAEQGNSRDLAPMSPARAPFAAVGPTSARPSCGGWCTNADRGRNSGNPGDTMTSNLPMAWKRK
eukprot:CAMPEP_0176125938 /NCGR_PEP_ID=MMETSP0120_2-20121206/63552_1 /TAXON_ID=160619 /ORGANISM="Kryptoperidinium foliaceum, Strain CCMP 1326" /LENGTH=84 /DNA_ID=CAMNT_0017460837 /DNA_START=192 /DNA_END=446 /DNA_ORIENTATION=-